MKVVIPQINLAALIARGAEVVAKNSPLDILNCIRLQACDDELAVASCDQDRFAEAIGWADVAIGGSVCVDAVAFKTLIGKHPKTGTIALETENGRLVVSCGRSKVKLPILPSDSFPSWGDQPPVSTFAFDMSAFKSVMNQVRFAASKDESRFYLQGVHFDAHDGKLHFVATDGNCMAIAGIKAPTGADTCPKIIVPSEVVAAALAIFDGAAVLNVAVDGKAITFSADSLRLSARLIDGQFPDYQRVVPERGHPGMSFKRTDFVDCLDRANVMTGDGKYMAVIARPDGDALRLESRNQKGGEALEEMSAVIADDFRPFGFSARYATDFLKALNVAELTIEQTGPDNPHLIYSDDAPDFLGILMPMRIAA